MRQYGSSTTTDRFFEKVVKSDGCWTWSASVTVSGSGRRYGKFKVHGKSIMAHRFSYEFHVGPIADGLCLDHLCKNTLCVNPAHLEPVTMRENLLRGDSFSAVNARKAHCKCGGDYMFSKSGARICRPCGRENLRRSRAKRKLSLTLQPIEAKK